MYPKGIVMELSQTSLLRSVIYALYNIASRRTSSKFAEETIEAAIETLQNKFPFFNSITFDSKSFLNDRRSIDSTSTIDNVDESEIGQAIEALIRIVYDDIKEEAGLYFVTEMKQYVGDKIVEAIIKAGVDLEEIQVEQHHAYRRQKRKKAAKSGKQAENLLGYTWTKVSRWEHKEESKYITLYDSEGNVLDRINLERVIQNYVENLSGVTETDPRELEKIVRIYEKEYNLLRLMSEQDMDAETARHILNITHEELENIINKLLEIELVKYVSGDTIKLTKSGSDYVFKEKKHKYVLREE